MIDPRRWPRLGLALARLGPAAHTRLTRLGSAQRLTHGSPGSTHTAYTLQTSLAGGTLTSWTDAGSSRVRSGSRGVAGRDSDRELNQGSCWGHKPRANNRAPPEFSYLLGVATRSHARLGYKDDFRRVKGCKHKIGKHRSFNLVYLIQKGM